MKNMKLFPKTFLHCLLLMIGVTLLAFLLIYLLLPVCYQSYKQRAIDSDTAQLAAELQTMSSTDITPAISDYATPKDYAYHAAYENGDVICSAVTGMSFEIVGGAAGESQNAINVDFDIVSSNMAFQTTDGKTVSLSLQASLQPIGDAMSALLLLLPIVLLLCLVLSILISYLYARTITKPIRDITDTTVRMRSLASNISCAIDRNDEIGVLSENINEMYQKLLATISGLEQEIQTVSKTEQEKLDFLLLASHELKTPVTAVRGMVDGMLYRVGVYKDRDTYLKECQKALEHLTELLCRILETSKIDAVTAMEAPRETDIGELLAKTASPYFLIAQSKGIDMTLSDADSFSACVCAELVAKALSNILSNAVKYTEAGKSIRIYIERRMVIIENECLPLSADKRRHIGEPFYRPAGNSSSAGDSTGLGLYFTDRILSACKLTYSFEPCENGMRFTLSF